MIDKTPQQLVDIAQASRRRRTCEICGEAKKTKHAFCVRCYYELPQELKQALSFGFVSDYLRAYVTCYRYLRRQEEQAATRLLEELKIEKEPFKLPKMFDPSVDEPMEGVPDLDEPV